MSILKRSGGFAVLLALIMVTTTTIAQDTTEIVGSGVVMPIVEAVASQADPALEVTTNITGTSAGFTALCDGSASITVASRGMNLEEETACEDNGIEFYELVIGYNIPVFITNPSDDFVQCLTSNEISQLFEPSAVANVTDWETFTQGAQTTPDAESDETGSTPIQLFTPRENTLNFLALDNLVAGVGVRSDATLADADDIIEQVANTSGSIGLVDLQALNTVDSVNLLQVDFAEVDSGCIAPSVENVETRLYTPSDRLFIYVNVNSADAEIVTALTDDAVTASVTEAGFSPASITTLDRNRQILAGTLGTGRQFTREITAFEIPPALFGEFTIAGSASAFDIANRVATTLSETQANLTVNFDIRGTNQGIEDLCAGSAAMAFATGDTADANLSACTDNEVTPIAFTIGTQATVLIANAANDDFACLTLDQISTIWGADSAETINNWSDVDASLPDADMTLFSPNAGNIFADIMMDRGASAIQPVRADAEINNDALYRAAAVANVTDSLTFMSFNDYLRVIDNEQQGIQLVAVDGGDGCISPTVDTITSGDYPLTRTTSLFVAQDSLADVNVQSYLWTLFADGNFNAFQSTGFVGLTFNDLPAIRDRLESEFETATEILNSRSAESETTEDTTETEDSSESEDTE